MDILPHWTSYPFTIIIDIQSQFRTKMDDRRFRFESNMVQVYGSLLSNYHCLIKHAVYSLYMMQHNADKQT